MIGSKRWDEMTKSIIGRWREQQSRFIDGNVMKFAGQGNLAYADQLKTLHDRWEDPSRRFDWEMLMEPVEAQLVMNPNWRKGS